MLLAAEPEPTPASSWHLCSSSPGSSQHLEVRAELGASRCTPRGPAWPSLPELNLAAISPPTMEDQETPGDQHGLLQTSIAQKPPAEGKLRHSLAGKSLVPLGRVDEEPEDQPQRACTGWVTTAGCGYWATSSKVRDGGWEQRGGGVGGCQGPPWVVSEHPEVALRVPVCWCPKGR